jgi:hypothetical protein
LFAVFIIGHKNAGTPHDRCVMSGIDVDHRSVRTGRTIVGQATQQL